MNEEYMKEHNRRVSEALSKQPKISEEEAYAQMEAQLNPQEKLAKEKPKA